MNSLILLFSKDLSPIGFAGSRSYCQKTLESFSVLLTFNSSYALISQVPDYTGCRIHTCINHVLDSVSKKGRLLGSVNWCLKLYAYCFHNVPPLLTGPLYVQEHKFKLCFKLKISPLKFWVMSQYTHGCIPSSAKHKPKEVWQARRKSSSTF